MQWYLFSLTFLFGFVYILRHGDNLRVDFLYTNMSEKRGALVDVAYCGNNFVFNSLLYTWYLGNIQSYFTILGNIK
ncbi:TRAP transporter small permease subunit [Trichormus azollae]|uniref:TRAP transporter small permease subunit n=1 Tax=Trichormus azollae TaxID=1164 RepID=UPI00325F83D2